MDVKRRRGQKCPFKNSQRKKYNIKNGLWFLPSFYTRALVKNSKKACTAIGEN